MLSAGSDEMAEAYGLSAEMVRDAVEFGVMRAVNTHMGICPHVIWGDGGLEIYAIYKGELRRINICEIGRRLKRRIMDEVEISLMQRSAINEAESLRGLARSVYPGVIEKINPDGSLIVHIQVVSALSTKDVFTDCPIRQQPPHERGTYQIGQTLEWYITSCLPVSNGRHAKVRVRLSRVTRELPAFMLKHLSGIREIKCIFRLPGKCSKIITRKRIPHDIIKYVGMALREHMDVRLV